jgi:hypothetical protein
MSVFKKLLQVGLKLMPVALMPWYMQTRSNCFFWNNGPSLARNKLENRSHVQVEISNSPCEDRNDTLQLTSIDGYAAAVYDGHGGWQVVLFLPTQSELCQKKLLQRLDEALGRNKGKYATDDELVSESIKEAFL